jgi:cell division protein FtsI/penicillin-binding protein 2
MTDVILHSDNVGMIFVGRKLGKSRILSYVRKFGFGKLSGIDLQEEDTPEIREDDRWQDVDWATLAFGQGIAVTRLQMLAAVNAIASGGNLYSPRLVTGIETAGVVKKVPAPPPVRVISQKAAATMTAMMINGVNNGEVRYYKVPGYMVAGKTGTAQVPIAGHYDEEKLIASFVGFAPAENPRFTMLVTLREPQTSPWGSTTAAPLWFGIAEGIFRYLHLPPKLR